MISYRAALILALSTDLLLYTRLVLTVCAANPAQDPRNLKRRLVPGLFWLPSTLGPGFYFSTLIQNESCLSLWHQQLIVVSLQWLYLEAFTVSRVRFLLF
jgi:hypothetical protein